MWQTLEISQNFTGITEKISRILRDLSKKNQIFISDKNYNYLIIK